MRYDGGCFSAAAVGPIRGIAGGCGNLTVGTRGMENDGLGNDFSGCITRCVQVVALVDADPDAVAASLLAEAC